jgi:hypothetical protein
VGLAHSPRIVTDGLVLALDAANTKSYPGNGDTWYDLSGSDISPVRKNGVTYTTQVGGEFNFDGVNDKFDFPNKTISNGNFLTIDIWVKVNDGTRYQDIFDTSDSGGGIWIVANGYAGQQPGKIATSFNTLSSATIYGSYTVGAWTHIAYVGNNGITSQYINGVLTGTDTENVRNNINFNNARIGNVDGDRANEYLNGSVASLKIYDRALSQEEVTQNFNAFRGRFGI